MPSDYKLLNTCGSRGYPIGHCAAQDCGLGGSSLVRSGRAALINHILKNETSTGSSSIPHNSISKDTQIKARGLSWCGFPGKGRNIWPATA